MQPTGIYSLSEIERINQTNGDLSLNIPLGSLGSDRAGVSHGFALIYNSKIWEGTVSQQSSSGDVNMRPMFGMRGVYRRKVVFAMLPDKRALENPKAIAYKRFEVQSKEGEKWKLLELENEEDIGRALAHLERPYRHAGQLGRSEF